MKNVKSYLGPSMMIFLFGLFPLSSCNLSGKKQADQTEPESSEEQVILKRDGIIPDRSENASENMIDLTDHYTFSLDDDWLVSQGANLRPLPKGIQNFNGVQFDVRGLIQLSGQNLLRESDEDKLYPEAVKDIKIDQTGKMIHFLHATSWKAEDGTTIGKYVIHYEDGQVENIPIMYMHSLKDWWARKEEQNPTDAEIAWSGQNEATRRADNITMVFKYTWENPFPAKKIEKMDFVSTMSTASPFLIAVTIET